MTDPKLTLLVLRTADLEAARCFYGALGLAFEQEKHGDGPTHYAGRSGDALIELYPLQQGVNCNDSTRLGFAVADLEAVLGRAVAAGAVVVHPARETAWGRSAVVRDPDGRKVELTQV